MVRRRRPPRPGSLTELSPLKIFSQIVVLQFVYYLSALILITFSALVAGKRINLDLVFNWRSLRGDTTVGWMLGMIWVLNSVTGIILMLVLIRRSKLVLDFTLTLHLIHLIIVSLFSRSIPQNTIWWATQLVSATMMTIMGIKSCQWRELRPINFGTDVGTSNLNSTARKLPNTDGNSRSGSDGQITKMGQPAESYEMARMMCNDLETES